MASRVRASISASKLVWLEAYVPPVVRALPQKGLLAAEIDALANTVSKALVEMSREQSVLLMRLTTTIRNRIAQRQDPRVPDGKVK